MTDRLLPWSAGTWTTEPVSAEVTSVGLEVEAVEGSDAWRHTSYGFVHDTEHALLVPFAVGRAVEITFTAAFREQFDQAGVFLRAGEETWIKAGVEFADGALQLGAVVTHTNSDWSVAPVPEWNDRNITIRVSRDDTSVTVRARVDAEPWRLVRVAPLAGNLDIGAGPLICAPTRAGFRTTFLSWVETAADTDLH
ncbi:DUF1349 domain-containing protein [Mycetocola tolaasinivorans]|uniref:DUF1349 domain-containing protein n=1 Tax=Mycetocola tolaasinivorans TaxID=76635 RepID=A0A3L7A3I3_9MICO|nr:DUF1349 domain-containing protein [Mycetocola tolaasinivorans]RLP74490.1 DUF1349 domain-containing protein [Mycetocola tolaasinivorans]